MANKTIDGMRRRPVAPTSVGVEGVRELRRRASGVPVRRATVRRTAAESEPVRPVQAKSARLVQAEPARPARRAEEVELSEDETMLMEAFNGTPRKEKMSKKKQAKQTRDDFLKPVSGFDMDISEEEIKKSQPKKKKVLKRVLIVLLILLLAGGVVAFVWGDTIIRKLTNGQSGLGDLIGTVVSDTYVDLKTDKNGRTNILAFGTSGWTMEDETHDGAALTDSIMVISIDEEAGDVAMVSLPRDLYLGTTCTSTGKINEVYWCNNIDDTDEKGGATALAEEVEKILGIDLQYYVHLNWAALVQVVDTLGGITVTVDEDINDYGWTNIVMEAGVPTTLNGEQALGLARARHGTESGDFTRAASQQKILVALKERILEQGISLTDAIGILNALGDNVRTSFTMEEIKSVYHASTTIDFSTMRSISLLDQGDGTSLVTTSSFDPSGLGYEVSFVVPAAGRYNYSDIRAYTKEQLSSDPIVRESPKVLVLNGSGEVGVASAEKSKLEADGFNYVSVGDAPEGYWEGTKIYDATARTPGSLAKITAKYGVEAISKVPAEVDATGYDIVIIIGVDKSAANEGE
ncbi:LCP family protein [Candidatus Saccharibacteria bacterium]|nr:LCP family protein [Candidatus Saccharibacteria bacterium]